MSKQLLFQSASELKQPGEAALHEFSNKTDELLHTINERFKQRPDLNLMIGAGNFEMMVNNHHNHLRFMASVFSHYQPEVLVETVLWVFRAYRSHGFKLSYWPAQLDTWVDIFKSHLSPECYHEIYPFYNWMIVNNPLFAKLSDEELRSDAEFSVAKHD